MWVLEPALTAKRTMGTREELEFYFPDRRVVATLGYQAPGKFWELDEQTGTQIPVKKPFHLDGRTNCVNEDAAFSLFQTAIAWRLLGFPDSRSLPPHWALAIRREVVLSKGAEPLLGPDLGYQLHVYQQEAIRAIQHFALVQQEGGVNFGGSTTIKYF